MPEASQPPAVPKALNAAVPPPDAGRRGLERPSLVPDRTQPGDLRADPHQEVHRQERRARGVGDLERCVALRTEELSRINEELRASEARYRNVVETQSEFIVRWRPDGAFTFVNDAYCRFFGVDPTTALGRTWKPCVHPDDLRMVEASIAQLTPESPAVACVNRVIRPNGEVSWTEWENRAFFDCQGAVVEFQAVGRDTTQLRAAADLLRQKEAHLAHLARLATMGEMVAGIAHEIGQPLHAAKTFAEAARRHLEHGRAASRETALSCLSEISNALNRTVAIICRLREFSKSRLVVCETTSLAEIAQDAIDLMAYEIRRVRATLDADLHIGAPAIVGDRIQLVQVVVNLLKNACESVESVPVSNRRIAIVVATAGADRVRLSVRDFGRGLQEVDADRLFEAFYSTKPHGMGLGLSLCKSIAEAHDAALWFEQAEGGSGLTFHLEMAARKEKR